MRKFVRQKSNSGVPDVSMNFGAAAAKVARVFEHGEYKLRIESAKVIQKNENILIVLDLIETETGGRVAGLPLWVDGPRSDAGNLTAENQHLIAQLLTLAKLPTVGNVSELIPNWPISNLMLSWCLMSIAAAARASTRLPVFTWTTRREGRAVHVRRRRSASC